MKKVYKVLLLSLCLVMFSANICHADVIDISYGPGDMILEGAMLIFPFFIVAFVAALSCFLIARTARGKSETPNRMEVVSELIVYIMITAFNIVIGSVSNMIIPFIPILITIVTVIVSIKFRKNNKKTSYIIAFVPTYIFALLFILTIWGVL